jgi:Protein of unknown function (DUF3224)
MRMRRLVPVRGLAIRRLLLRTLLLGGVALLLLGATVAHAQPVGQPILASGTLSSLGLPTVLAAYPVAGVTLLHQTEPEQLTGTFSGTLLADEWLVVRPDGAITLHASETFTGSVANRAGTVTVVVTGNSDGGTFLGHFAIQSGTGDLATLRGQGSFTGDAQTGAGMYTALIQVLP